MPKIKGGYILQPRVFDESEAAHFPPATREVWLWLLRNVNWTDNEKSKTPRGTGFFTFKQMQEGLSWSVGYRKETYSKTQLTKALRRLNEGSMTETMKTTRGIRVTIVNFDRYQDPNNYEGNTEGNTKETRRQRTDITISKEGYKKEKKDNGFMVPSEEEVSAYMQSRGVDVTTSASEAERFCDHHTARGWVMSNGKKMSSWQAAVRTWVGNMSRYNGYAVRASEPVNHMDRYIGSLPNAS